MPETTTETMPAPPAVVERVLSISRTMIDLYGRNSARTGSDITRLLKADTLATGETVQSHQGVILGRKPHPFDMRAVTEYQTSNEHHGTCIQTKTAATVGLGFHVEGDENPQGQSDGVNGPGVAPAANPLALQRSAGKVNPKKRSKADDVLDPLTEHSFQDVLNDVAEDFWQCGNGWMEVVRRSGAGKQGAITGIHHIPAPECYVFIENALYDRHYEIVGTEGIANSRRFAKFGDRDSFLARRKAGGGLIDFSSSNLDDDMVSEVIHFRRPSSLSRWYGFPDWLSCVASIELVQCLHQHKYDFFLNRGVPEFMLFILGATLSKDDWKKVEDALKANIGLGNSHKSLALNLNNENITVQLEKLAMEKEAADEFDTVKNNLALGIVTAHRVPPPLAGILIPGRLGATNEIPNVLMAFQALVIGPVQRLFKQVLGQTLGNKSLSGLDLTSDDFAFREITEVVDVGLMNTVTGMKQTVPEAKASGRNLDAGLKN